MQIKNVAYQINFNKFEISIYLFCYLFVLLCLSDISLCLVIYSLSQMHEYFYFYFFFLVLSVIFFNRFFLPTSSGKFVLCEFLYFNNCFCVSTPFGIFIYDAKDLNVGSIEEEFTEIILFNWLLFGFLFEFCKCS